MIYVINPEQLQTPSPRYAGTVVCPHCHAEYKPGNWRRGYYEGTSDQFNPLTKVPEGHCPICLKGESSE